MHKLYLVVAISAICSSSALAAEPSSLMDVYQLAVQNNADLAAAHANYKAQSEVVPQAKAGLLPQIGLGAGLENSRTTVTTSTSNMPLVGTVPGRKSTSNRNGHVYQASLSQPLFRLDRWYQLKAAQAVNEQATIELSAVEQALILNSAEIYFAILRAQDNLATTKAEEKAFKRQFDQANEAFKVGLTDKTDVLQAQAAYDATRANRILAERMVKDGFEALTTLTNTELEAIEGIKHSLPVLAPVPNNAQQWVDTATQQNLQLQAINYAVDAANESVKQRKSGHAPSVDAIIQYRKGDNDALGFTNSGSPYAPHFRGNAEQSSIGIQLTIPLYTGGMISSQVREGVYRLEYAEQQRESIRRQIVQNTRNYHRAVNTDVEQIQARKQAIISNQSAVEATQVGYDVGTRNIVDVLDAQRQLYASVRNYNDARYSYILNNLRLQQAAGTLSPNDLTALSNYLSPTYNPDKDFLPPIQ